mgnify:CR=1 FL=1
MRLRGIMFTEAATRPQRKKEMSSVGIDYGLGMANRDPKSGIRYGVISLHSISSDYWDRLEQEDATACPYCGDAVKKSRSKTWDCFCPTCQEHFFWENVASDDPDAPFSYKGDGYKIEGSGMDMFVTKSRFFTHAVFCSPCAPGAGDLDSPHPEGVRTFCLGHEWFETGVAPYPVYDRKTGKLVPPPEPSE